MPRRLLRIFSFFIVLVSLCLAAGWRYRIPLTEKGLNKALHDYFGGTLTLQDLKLQKGGILTLKGLKGRYQARDGGIPLEIQSLQSQSSVLDLLEGKTLPVKVAGVRTGNSSGETLEGDAQVRIGSQWHFEFRAKIISLELRDLTPLSPENLEGASGILKGTLTLRTDAREDPVFGLVLNVFEPGGNLQARFFDLITPYLPQIQARSRVEQLAASKKTVSYKNAHLNIGLEDPQQMKLFFHILVPDYNLDLNINMAIRVDRKNAFFELAEVLGLVQVKAA